MNVFIITLLKSRISILRKKSNMLDNGFERVKDANIVSQHDVDCIDIGYNLPTFFHLNTKEPRYSTDLPIIQPFIIRDIKF